MISLLFQNPVAFIIIAALLVMALSVHEFAHAFAAEKLGDPTPKLMGRLTLNPKAHLDPVGTMLLLVAGFGWGRPVPFDPFNLRNPKRDAAVISFAGPLSNLVMALVSAILIRIFISLADFPLSGFLTEILGLFLYFNIILAVFNLMPVSPLDGFKVVAGLLPEKYYRDWMELERYGVIFLLLLIFPFFGSSAILKVISPIVSFIMSVLLPGSPGDFI